jgi:hypothetical protein
VSGSPQSPLSLRFDAYSAAWRGQSLLALTAEVTAPRLALIGAWGAFCAHLAGAPDAVVTGAVTLGGAPLRPLVESGRVGVARSDQSMPGTQSVGAWLADCLILGGVPAAAAARQVRSELEGRGLGFLRTRRLAELSPTESFGAQLAFALLGGPQLAVLPAPRVKDALLPFCQRLLDEAARSCQIALVFDGEPDLARLRWCDHVIAAQAGSPTTNCSVASWLTQAAHYRLVSAPSAAAEQLHADTVSLETRLAEHGVVVHNPGQKRLLLSLPEPGTTDRVLRACQDAALGVRELTPLFFGPSAG